MHPYASLLIAQGEHPKYIQSQLGHSSINVTMDIYGHLMESVNQKAASLLGRTVLGNEDNHIGHKEEATSVSVVNR